MLDLSTLLYRIIEYFAMFLLGCKLCGARFSRKLGTFPLIFVFPLTELAIHYMLNGGMSRMGYPIYLLLLLLTRLGFFFASFMQAEDLSEETVPFFRSEDISINIVNISGLFICDYAMVFVLGTIYRNICTHMGWLLPSYRQLPAYLLLLITAYCIYLLVPLTVFRKVTNRRQSLFQLLMINIFLAACPLLLESHFSLSNTQKAWLFSGCCIILIPLNLIIFHFNKVILHQQQLLAAFDTYMPVVDKLVRQIRDKQHSYDNVIQSISMLPATHEDYNTLTAALHTYCSSLPSGAGEIQLLKLNLRLVAGFLISKKETALEQQKELLIDVQNSWITTRLPEYLLVEIIGILLDNAIEATPPGGRIYVSIDSRQDKFFMQTRNPGPMVTRELRNHFFKHGYTTKTTHTHSHGLGLSRLNYVINANHGHIILSNEIEEDITYIIFELEI